MMHWKAEIKLPNSTFTIFSWLFVSIVFLAYTFFLIPQRGFDFTDHGYYLYNAMLLTHGMVPSVGFAGVISALAMMLGLDDYLVMEMVYAIFGCSVILFSWYSLRGSIKSAFLPYVLLSAATIQHISYLPSYQNMPVFYIILGYALFCKYLDHDHSGYGYAISSAFVLALACFSNISMLPVTACILIVSISLILYTSKKSTYIFPCLFISFSVIFFLLYINSPLALFGPYGHTMGPISQNSFSIHFYINKFLFLFNHIFLSSHLVILWLGASVVAKFVFDRYKSMRLRVIFYINFTIVV